MIADRIAAVALATDHLAGLPVCADDSDKDAAVNTAIDALKHGASAASAIFAGYEIARERAKARFDNKYLGVATSAHPAYTLVFGKLYEQAERENHDSN